METMLFLALAGASCGLLAPASAAHLKDHTSSSTVDTTSTCAKTLSVEPVSRAVFDHLYDEHGAFDVGDALRLRFLVGAGGAKSDGGFRDGKSVEKEAFTRTIQEKALSDALRRTEQMLGEFTLLDAVANPEPPRRRGLGGLLLPSAEEEDGAREPAVHPLSVLEKHRKFLVSVLQFIRQARARPDIRGRRVELWGHWARDIYSKEMGKWHEKAGNEFANLVKVFIACCACVLESSPNSTCRFTKTIY